MKKTPRGENAILIYDLYQEHVTLNINQFYRKEASVDAHK